MARWPSLLVALGLLGLPWGVASAQETPIWLQESMGLLVSACADHNPPAEAVEVPSADVPGSLRRHYRNASAGSYRRLSASETFYLLQIPNPSRSFRAVCAVAVPKSRSSDGRLFALFNAINQVEPQIAAALGRDLDLSAITVDSWILVEVSLHAVSRAQ
jgi:hypothetical protein